MRWIYGSNVLIVRRLLQYFLPIIEYWTQPLVDLDNLPDPDLLALDIVENLEAGLESFRAIIASLNSK